MMEGVLSFHLYMISGDESQVARQMYAIRHLTRYNSLFLQSLFQKTGSASEREMHFFASRFSIFQFDCLQMASFTFLPNNGTVTSISQVVCLISPSVVFPEVQCFLHFNDCSSPPTGAVQALGDGVYRARAELAAQVLPCYPFQLSFEFLSLSDYLSHCFGTIILHSQLNCRFS